MKRRTKELLGTLKRLSADARTNIFKRIELVAAILKDHDWLAEVYDGDEGKAQKALQDEHFYELNGVFTLGVLLQIHSTFPTEAEWKEVRFNLAAMRVKWMEQRTVEGGHIDRASVTRIKKADYEDAVKKCEAVEQRLEQSDELLKSRNEDLDGLRGRVAELESENATLRGRISELKRVVDRQLQPA